MVEVKRASQKPISLIAGRYRVDEILGHGGVAEVYRARDESTGRALAVKWLKPRGDKKKQAKLIALFEREYHTLTHLNHPSVIEVYDYGIDESRPYYTMELLQGSDLWECAPLPWQKVCSILIDICSCLALLHSRRLVHRDISPRNIRLTPEARAKLIDFGSLAVMGKSKDLVGTPSFIAPEVINGLALDGGTDLYAVGAVAYWALTRRRAYPARRMSEIKDVFRSRPMEVSALVPEVPAALNNLVMSMISLDPLARPGSAAEVIERLTGIAKLPALESPSVAQAYLTTPLLVGRDDVLMRFRKQVLRAVAGSGSSIMVEGRPGMGRSRLLASYVLEGKLAGAIVLQADGDNGMQGDFGVVRALAEDLLQTAAEWAQSAAVDYADALGSVLPALARQGDCATDRGHVSSLGSFGEQQSALMQRGFTNWLLSLARERCLVLAVDDVHRADPPSAAVLAMLAHEASQHKLVVAVTTDIEAEARAPKAVELLSQAGGRIKLRPLAPDATEKLLRSLFGEVSNLKVVSDWINSLAQGNPRTSMELAQHLVDRRIAVYQAGGWALPAELGGQPLPQSLEQALDARVQTLSDPALALAQTLSLTTYFAPLGLADFLTLLSDTYKSQEVFSAFEELVAANILVGSDDQYSFRQRDLAEAMRRGLTDERRRVIHLKLATQYQASGVYSAFIAAYHFQQADEQDKALDAVLSTSSRTRVADPVFRSAYGVQTLERALQYAEQKGRPALDLYRLRKALLQFSAFVEPSPVRYADRIVEQLREDTGLSLWDQQDPAAEPAERINCCLQLAQARFESAPAAQRGLPPLRAIRELAVCVVMMTSAHGRGIDIDGLKALPALINPYRSLSPLLDLTCEFVDIVLDQAMARTAAHRMRTLLDKLAHPIEGLDDVSRMGIRYAFTYYVALEEATTGKPSAFASAEVLLRQPNYAALGWQIRMLTHLYRGEPRQAAECRERTELLAIQNIDSNMHLVTGILYEAYAYELIGDLLELKRVLDTVEKYARVHPGWVPHLHSLRGCFHQLRGELETAKGELETALAMVSPGKHNAWWCGVVCYIQLLLEVGDYDRVKSVSQQAIESCETSKVGYLYVRYVEVGLALAEAKTGDSARAITRLDGYIEQARIDGVQGIFLGYAYESRARAALWSRDTEAFDKFAKLTADVYLPGNSGPLVNRYQKLLREAQEACIGPLGPSLSPKDSLDGLSDSFFSIATTAIRAELDMCRGPKLRAQHVLRLLIEYTGATGGYLYGLQNKGLNLVAAHQGEAPPSGMQEAVNALLSLKEAPEDSISSVSYDDIARETHKHIFVDSNGHSHQLIALSAFQEGRTLLTGVAVLGKRRSGQLRAPPRELVSALSEGLLGAGDVTAVVVQ
jgi:tRNA A-37 threonylcarbamoyl transferase component Bud32